MSVLRKVTLAIIRRAAPVLAVVVVLLLAAPASAHAQTGDSYESVEINYEIGHDAVIHVTEKRVFHFGKPWSSKGIFIEYLTREPWDEDYDAVYKLENLKVSSPDQDDTFKAYPVDYDIDRENWLRVDIGYQRIDGETGTYILEYDLVGALISPGDYSEFHWDVLFNDGLPIDNLEITVSAPNGVTDISCSSAPMGKYEECTTSTITGDKAEFTEEDKHSYDVVTIGARFAKLDAAQPTLVNRPGRFTKYYLVGIAIAGVVVAIMTALLAGGDRRFSHVAPGTIPLDPKAPTKRDDRPIIPVAFEPPDLPIASAGFLLDGSFDSRDFTAAVLALATRGIIQIRMSRFGRIYVKVVNRTLPMNNAERTLLNKIVPSFHYNKEINLDYLKTQYRSMTYWVASDAMKAKWYIRNPHISGIYGDRLSWFFSSLPSLFYGLYLPAGIIALVFVAKYLDRFPWEFFLLLVAVWLGLLTGLAFAAKGRRSALGRAYTDRIEGFRQYLTTAEADQLRFEEGQDIFSAYLPWAVLFDDAERWTRICHTMIEAGKIPVLPTWYYGDIESFKIPDLSRNLRMLSYSERPLPRYFTAPASNDSGNSGSDFWSDPFSGDSGSWGGGRSSGGFGGGGGFGGSRSGGGGGGSRSGSR